MLMCWEQIDEFVAFLAFREQDLYTATVSPTALGPVVLRNIAGETFCHLCHVTTCAACFFPAVRYILSPDTRILVVFVCSVILLMKRQGSKVVLWSRYAPPQLRCLTRLLKVVEERSAA